MGRFSELNLACRSRKSHREKGLGSIAVFLDKHALFWTNSATSQDCDLRVNEYAPLVALTLSSDFFVCAKYLFGEATVAKAGRCPSTGSATATTTTPGCVRSLLYTVKPLKLYVLTPEITMARVNLSRMTVEALMDLRKRVHETLLKRRAEFEKQLERMEGQLLSLAAEGLLEAVGVH